MIAPFVVAERVAPLESVPSTATLAPLSATSPAAATVPVTVALPSAVTLVLPLALITPPRLASPPLVTPTSPPDRISPLLVSPPTASTSAPAMPSTRPALSMLAPDSFALPTVCRSPSALMPRASRAATVRLASPIVRPDSETLRPSIARLPLATRSPPSASVSPERLRSPVASMLASEAKLLLILTLISRAENALPLAKTALSALRLSPSLAIARTLPASTLPAALIVSVPALSNRPALLSPA